MSWVGRDLRDDGNLKWSEGSANHRAMESEGICWTRRVLKGQRTREWVMPEGSLTITEAQNGNKSAFPSFQERPICARMAAVTTVQGWHSGAEPPPPPSSEMKAESG